MEDISLADVKMKQKIMQ